MISETGDNFLPTWLLSEEGDEPDVERVEQAEVCIPDLTAMQVTNGEFGDERKIIEIEKEELPHGFFEAIFVYLEDKTVLELKLFVKNRKKFRLTLIMKKALKSLK